jgi:hypothetical protein
MRGERIEVMAPQDKGYTNTPHYTLVAFDLRFPGAAEALCSWQSACQGRCHIEEIDGDHCVLVIYPGTARSS